MSTISLRAFPFGLVDLELRMRHEEMPDHGLKRLGMWRDMIGIDGGDDDAGGGLPGCKTAITTHDSDNGRTHLPGELDRRDEIRADILFQIAATDGKNHQRVLCIETTALEPFGKNGGPALVVGPGGQLGDIVGRRINLESANLAKIVDGMGRIGRATTDTEDKESSAAFANTGQHIHDALDGLRVELGNDFLGLFKVLARKAHRFRGP